MKVCFGNEFSQVVNGDARVVLVPSRSRAWCAATFHGTVWDVITLNCGSACPASQPPSSWIGKVHLPRDDRLILAGTAPAIRA